MRIVEGENVEGEKVWENELRPQSFEEFPGQFEIKDQLLVFVKAAKARGEPLDHTLLSGPPGLGKTTLARILAAELGVECRVTSAPALDKKGEMAAVLTSLTPGSILFIDEIHRLQRVLEEYLYSAMEDFSIDLITGEGLGARTMKFQLPPFTLIGATTRAGLLTQPFRDRFGITARLQFYDRESLKIILQRSAQILKVHLHPDGAQEIACRARGTPRIANRLLKRVRDYAQVQGNGQIDGSIAKFALNKLGVDQFGLDLMDRRLLELMRDKYAGGPVGVETMAAALSEEKETLEEVYEPYLIQEGFIQKTPRGRMLTDYARKIVWQDSN